VTRLGQVPEEGVAAASLADEVDALYRHLYMPGTNRIADAAEPCVTSDGDLVFFTATVLAALQGGAPTRLAMWSPTTATPQLIDTHGSCRSPSLSADDRWLCFLSDDGGGDGTQLCLLEVATLRLTRLPVFGGWVEQFRWCPDSLTLLAVVADHGADVAGRQGGITSDRRKDAGYWHPDFQDGPPVRQWRSLWLHDIQTGARRELAMAGETIWEAAWAGPARICALVSNDPSESGWYGAAVWEIDRDSGARRSVYRPRHQVSHLVVDPTGTRLALIEGLSSDRGLVAGELKIVELPAAATRTVDLGSFDASSVEWRSSQKLLVGGHQGVRPVVVLHEIGNGHTRTIWTCTRRNSGEYLSPKGFGESGNCVVVAESFLTAPQILRIGDGVEKCLFDLSSGDPLPAADRVVTERVTWDSHDGLELEGLLIRRADAEPAATIVNLHGGPVAHWRPMWLGRGRWPFLLLLLERGYSLFFPNPRGSSGRGRMFAERVVGDVGGGDAADILAGIDTLVQRGLTDPGRVGLIGGSYGGYLTSWLVTRRDFAAAVAVSPITNLVTQHLLSNIPAFTARFVSGSFQDRSSQFHLRSPVFFADRVATPTLLVAGARDRCTPSDQAAQFHAAIVGHGGRSALAIYPEEGHGIRSFPAALDFVARVLAWFETYMPARPVRARG
jgi:dipeptidyl aminopeptidase/acylaminoacyl peptidase